MDDEDHDDQDELLCFDCGEPHDQCECHLGAECGRMPVHLCSIRR